MAQPEQRVVMTIPQVMGANLARLREALGMTQEDLGEAVARLGFRWGARQTVSAAEQGHRPLSFDEWLTLSALFDVGPWVFLLPLPHPASGDLEVTHVRVGGRVAAAGDFAEAAVFGEEDALITAATDAVADPPRKDWRDWVHRRRRGTPIKEAWGQARQARLATRSRPAGPTFVSDEDRTIPYGIEIPYEIRPETVLESEIVMEASVPYTARDEIEADVLRARARAGLIRQVRRRSPPAGRRFRSLKNGS